MTHEKKSPQPNPDETTGKDGATTSIQQDAREKGSHEYNGQQGTAGVGGLQERTRPHPTGGQPHLGGSDASHSGAKPGTGLSEDSDPESREQLPDLESPAAEGDRGRAPGAGGGKNGAP